MANQFYVRKLYTWVNENSAFHTAKIFKGGEPKGTIALADANNWCSKWNGRSGDFEQKKSVRAQALAIG